MVTANKCRKKIIAISFVISIFFLFLNSTSKWSQTILLIQKQPLIWKSININQVPKLAHYMILGESPPAYMMEMVRVSMDRIRSAGFEAKLWRDIDADRLVSEFGDPRLSQSWEYVKADNKSSRYAKMADFLRPLVMYVEGGVYLDTDMVPCGSLDYLVDEPGVVSFPFLIGRDEQVNGAAMSAPPGHPLMRMALDSFINLGQDISWMHNLIAAGPNRMGIVTDEYLKTLGMDLPPLFSTTPKDSDGYNPYTDAPEVTIHEEFWTRIADIRFYEPKTNFCELSTYHLHFKSWIGDRHDVESSVCFKNTELIKGFIDWMCKPDIRTHSMRFNDCGKHLSS